MNLFRQFYLSWVNEFLTFERFAEYYRLTANQAKYVIREGKKIHEKELKSCN